MIAQILKSIDKITPKNIDEVRRQLCKADLRYLATKELGFNDWDGIHDEVVVWLDQNKSVKFKLLLLPRGHLKTSIFTIARTIQHLLVDHNIKILLDTAVWQNSRTFLTEIKAYLAPGSKLSQLFGEFQQKEGGWTQDGITIRQRTKPDKSSTIDTSGIEKTVTSQHYDKIIADDLVTRENVTNKDQINKVINHFKDLLKLLEPNGTLEVIGTRWHDADLYGYIIKNLTGDKVSEELGAHKFMPYIRRAVENGKPIFPKKFTLAGLAALRISLGSYEYAANYDNDPLDPENQLFPRPFHYWHEQAPGLMKIITVDLATDVSNSDWNVVSKLGYSKTNQMYFLKYRRGHVDPFTVIDWIFELVCRTDEHGNPTKELDDGLLGVGVEAVQYQRVMIYLLQVEMKKRGIIFPVYPIIPHTDKFTRLRALQPWHERGDLLLKPGMTEAEEEFERFPVGANDDIMDTVEMGMHLFMGFVQKKAAPAPYAELQKTSPASANEWERVDKMLKKQKDFNMNSVLNM